MKRCPKWQKSVVSFLTGVNMKPWQIGTLTVLAILSGGYLGVCVKDFEAKMKKKFPKRA